MSKIKKLTTQLKNSSFAPDRKRVRTEEVDSIRYKTMDEANNDITGIYNESKTIFSENDYSGLDNKKQKEVDNLNKTISSIYNTIISGTKRLTIISGLIVNAKVALSKLKIIKKVNLKIPEQITSSNTLSQPESTDLNLFENREICSLQQLDENSNEYKEKKEKVIRILGGTETTKKFVEFFKIDVKTGCDVDEIVKRIKLKLKLIEEGYSDQYKLKDSIIDYVSYDDIEDLGLNTIYDIIEDFEKYKRKSYTPKQLKKTYEQISDSFIIEGYSREPRSHESIIMINYIKTFKDNPEYMLRTLLWVDTFHDFKESRIESKLNDIIQGFYPDEANYDFDVFYRNSFFKFENKNNNTEISQLKKNIENFSKQYYSATDKEKKNIEKLINKAKRRIKQLQVSGFSDDIVHTVLSGIEINKEMAQLLFDVSEIVINKEDFESDLFYAYMIINFNIKLDSKETFMIDLKNILWNQISAEDVPYYSKDVDRGSGNLLQGNLVILPASVFDANPSNSSDDGKNFVKIENTVIPFANGYNFEYNFKVEDEETKERRTSEIKKKQKRTKIENELISKDDCFFKLNYTLGNKVYTLTELENKCLSSYESDNESKNIYKALDKAINDKNLDAVKDLIGELYFNGNINGNQVKIPRNTKGMSPGDIVTVIIGLIKSNKIISCKILDFWVSLKRIGDYGQILQCKQLGIPLFTTDSMQLLISLVVKSSVVWSPDFTKVLWYNEDNDAIMCNGLNPNVSKYECSINRINKNYKEGDKVVYKEGDKVVYKERLWSVILPPDNGKYMLKEYGKTMIAGDVSFSDIKPYDINYILFKKDFKPLLFSNILLENTVDKDTQILRELKDIPNIRRSIETNEVEMKEAD